MAPAAWSLGFGATDAGPRARNEDSFCAAPPVYIVADGMGGHAAGADASSAVAHAFLRLASLPVIIDFGGTASQHPGNLNATSAIVRSAVIYVLRLLVGESLPLNEGTLSTSSTPSRTPRRSPHPSNCARNRVLRSPHCRLGPAQTTAASCFARATLGCAAG